jgi:hypothetical protein
MSLKSCWFWGVRNFQVDSKAGSGRFLHIYIFWGRGCWAAIWGMAGGRGFELSVVSLGLCL